MASKTNSSSSSNKSSSSSSNKSSSSSSNSSITKTSGGYKYKDKYGIEHVTKNYDTAKQYSASSSGSSSVSGSSGGTRDIKADNEYRISLLNPFATPLGLTRGNGLSSTDILRTEFSPTKTGGGVERIDHLVGGKSVTFIPNIGVWRKTSSYADDPDVGDVYNRQDSAYGFTTYFDRSQNGSKAPLGFSPTAFQDSLNAMLDRTRVPMFTSSLMPTATAGAINYTEGGNTYSNIGGKIYKNGVLVPDANLKYIPSAVGGLRVDPLPTQQSFNAAPTATAATATPFVSAMSSMPVYQPYEFKPFQAETPNYSITSNPDDTVFVPTSRAKDRWMQQEQMNYNANLDKYKADIQNYQQAYDEWYKQQALEEEKKKAEQEQIFEFYKAAGLLPVLPNEKELLDKIHEQYAIAKANNDKATMDRLHQQAEIIRQGGISPTWDRQYQQQSLDNQLYNMNLDAATQRRGQDMDYELGLMRLNQTEQPSASEMRQNAYEDIYAMTEYYTNAADVVGDLKRFRSKLEPLLGTSTYNQLLKTFESEAETNTWKGSQSDKWSSVLKQGGSPIRQFVEQLGKSSASTSGNLSSWVKQAMEITGVGADWYEPLIWLAQHESSGNPLAKNKQAVGGQHATGLMQTLPSTFNSYKMPGMGDIYNPVHNLVAAINYIKSKYGHPQKAVSGWASRGGY